MGNVALAGGGGLASKSLSSTLSSPSLLLADGLRFRSEEEDGGREGMFNMAVEREGYCAGLSRRVHCC